MAEHSFAGMTCSDVAELAPAFVLGILNPAESDAVRRHLAECPELHAEMAELNSVVPALFEAVEPVAPPAALKQRILAAAAAELESRQAGQARPPAAQTRAAPPASPARRRWDLGALFRRPVWAALAAVALIAAVALGAWNAQLRDQVAGLETYRNGVAEILDQAARPGAQLAVLSSPDNPEGPTGLASVGADGSVAIVMRDLSPTAGTQVYEAWLIGGDGVPVAIGDFRVGASGSAAFTTTHAAMGEGVAVALTREPRAGATTPTLPIIAVGTAHSQPS
jgi:anti-sigma factor RsiW